MLGAYREFRQCGCSGPGKASESILQARGTRQEAQGEHGESEKASNTLTPPAQAADIRGLLF